MWKIDFRELLFWDVEKKKMNMEFRIGMLAGQHIGKGELPFCRRSLEQWTCQSASTEWTLNLYTFEIHTKVPHDCFDNFMRITIVKECSPYCAKVIFSNKEKQPCNWAYIQFASPYHDFFQHVPSYLLWKWVCIDVVGVERGEALDYNVGECRPGEVKHFRNLWCFRNA